MDWLKRLWKRLVSADSSLQGVGSSSQGGFVRPAVWADVFELTRLLEKHGAEYILVGGYALNFNGLVRQTGDIDILVRNNPQNNVRWIAALCELPDGAAKELVADSDAPFPVDTDEGDDEPGVIRVADEFLVDVMPKTCGKTYEDLLPYASRVTTEGGAVRVLDLHGLLLTKQGIRAKDVADRKLIETALATLRQRTSEHVATMARRSFLKDAPLPPAGEYEIRGPDADEAADVEDELPQPKPK